MITSIRGGEAFGSNVDETSEGQGPHMRGLIRDRHHASQASRSGGFVGPTTPNIVLGFEGTILQFGGRLLKSIFLAGGARGGG